MRQITSLVLAAVAALAAAPAATAAETLYHVGYLDSLGGASSSGNSLNDFGLIAGTSNLADDEHAHAAAWLYGAKRDLGTLGGPNSNVVWPVKNVFGRITGIAQTSKPQPLGESWSCSAFFVGADAAKYTCLGFVWEFGRMRALPTLGGDNGFATGSNNLGQTVGWAENTVRDPTCTNGQVLQFRPVVWGPRPRQIRELPLPPGDSSGAATALNDSGQIVGISGICDQAVGRFSAAHAVLWEGGRVTDLGNLGGVAWNTPMAINRNGDVVGFANVPGGATPGSLNEHAFLWTRDGGMQDLGTLGPEDVHSQALGINDRRQVVGVSCTAHFASCRPFLWQDGAMVDLNARLAAGYDGVLVAAQDINDLGQITGQAFDPASGTLKAYWAIPAAGDSAAAGTTAMHDGVRLPVHARRALLRRLGFGTAAAER
ncbi:extracellular repeat protein, HAF family [Mizugakiibacter sediminis]|uniref:Extracellular repeat protein, HAF family n=1 Tax=Mizugakiibacter sediminis TaxID=1475481 RepID=A0A0K8QK11_9GAMM|nr:HAF repeat-containing protein [Mizugakiibacter sediminis]GAP65178.1 extracellular repeat protein, HAF family [Mizugakiibacter sediminis]